MMKRKPLIYLLSLLMILTCLPLNLVHANSKLDVLQEKKIVIGRDGGDLKLDAYLTRAEAMKLIVHGSDLEGKMNEIDWASQSFKDVPKSHWAHDYIEFLRAAGVAKGMPDGNFYPEKPVTYQEMITFIVRLDKGFKEGAPITGRDWAKPYLNYAAAKGMLSGVEIKDFNAPALRRDIFDIVYNGLPMLEENNRLRDKVVGKEIGTWLPSDSGNTGKSDNDSKPTPDPKPNPDPKPDPGKNDTPEMKDARRILGEFIDKAKSRLAGLTPSDETDPKKIEEGEVVAKQADIDALNAQIKAAEEEFNNPEATLESLQKEKADLEQATIDFKTVEGEKPATVDPYVKEDFVIEGKAIKGLTEQGKAKLEKNKNNLVIPAIAGVEEIADNAFANQPIKVLTLDGSIKTVGGNAFLKCGIAKLNLKDGIEHVKARAFSKNNITSLSIPGTLNNVEPNGFADSNIVNLTFEEGVTFIGDSAFSSNAISDIKFPSTLKEIDLGAFKSNLVETVNFPDGLETIAPKIFCRNKITEVTVPNSLKVFCGNSFRFNPGFEGDNIFKIYLKDPVEITSLDGKTVEEKLSEVVQLRPYIFKGQIKDEKTPLDIESWELLERKDGVSTYSAKFEQISDEKLNDLLGPNKGDGTSNETVQENLKKIRLIVKVKISKDTLGVWDADDFTVEGNKITGFSDQGKERVATDKNLVIPAIDGVDTIAKSAFKNPTRDPKYDLTSVEIPKNIKTIEMAAFGANPIEKVRFNEGLETIGSSAFLAHHIKELQFPDSLKSVGDMAFMADRKMPTLERLALGKNLETIGRNAFMNGKLTELVCNENLKTIDVNAFSGNDLTSVKFNKALEEISCSAFGNNQLTEVHLPFGLKKICENAFSGNTDIEVVLGNRLGVKGMTPDEVKALLNEKITTQVGYGKGGASLAKAVDWEIAGDTAKPVFDPSIASQIPTTPFVVKLDALIDSGTDQDIDDDYTGVPWTAEDFVVTDGTLTGIADSAKDKLATSNRVTIPAHDAAGNPITKVAPSLFGRNASDPDDTKIKELVIEDGIEEIGGAAFRNNLIEEVVIPDSVKTIGGGAFSNCEQLKKVTLSKSLTEIAPSVFYGCPIQEVTIPDGVTTIGMRAFQNADIRNLTIPASVTEIKSNAFTNNKNLQDLVIPGTVKTIGNSAFSYCGLINLTLEEGIETIGKQAFRYNNIKKVTIPASVTNLDDSAFNDNIGIEIIRN